jgi:hypothetical protein
MYLQVICCVVYPIHLQVMVAYANAILRMLSDLFAGYVCVFDVDVVHVIRFVLQVIEFVFI